MCFSATGSFVVAGTLGALGAVSIARNSSKRHRMFAALPLIFAAQQASEGVVWLTINDPASATLHRLAVSSFLAFALVIWPTWLPWSLRLVEQRPARRRALTLLFGLGVLVAACGMWFIARWQPAAHIAGHSIRYDYAGSQERPGDFFYLIVYLVPTVVPLFVSKMHLARTTGTTLVVSLAVTVFMHWNALVSVWCFFAAILSGLILLAVERAQHTLAFSPPSAQ